MTEEKKKKECPECNGKKTISGTCECSSEWRGTLVGDEWDECQCTPDAECPGCNGTGFVET